jgi:hypothetical protein
MQYKVFTPQAARMLYSLNFTDHFLAPFLKGFLYLLIRGQPTLICFLYPLYDGFDLPLLIVDIGEKAFLWERRLRRNLLSRIYR